MHGQPANTVISSAVEKSNCIARSTKGRLLLAKTSTESFAKGGLVEGLPPFVRRYAPRFLRAGRNDKRGKLGRPANAVISSVVEKSNCIARSTKGRLPLAKGAAERSEAEGFAPTGMRQEF